MYVPFNLTLNEFYEEIEWMFFLKLNNVMFSL